MTQTDVACYKHLSSWLYINLGHLGQLVWGVIFIVRIPRAIWNIRRKCNTIFIVFQHKNTTFAKFFFEQYLKCGLKTFRITLTMKRNVNNAILPLLHIQCQSLFISLYDTLLPSPPSKASINRLLLLWVVVSTVGEHTSQLYLIRTCRFTKHCCCCVNHGNGRVA